MPRSVYPRLVEALRSAEELVKLLAAISFWLGAIVLLGAIIWHLLVGSWPRWGC